MPIMAARETQGRRASAHREVGNGTISVIVANALIAGWITIPALQYIAADQRMRLITTGHAPLEGLVLVDLTPVYGLLLAATVVHVTLRWLRRDRVSSKA